MKFFIDTADLKEIEQAASYGVLDGVTTNPCPLGSASPMSCTVGHALNP